MATLLTLIAMLSASYAAAAPSCGELEKLFAQSYENIRTDCAGHADCAVGHYNWDPCAIQAVAKEQDIQDFEKTRSDLHRLCGYIVKPCAAFFEPTYCVQGRCAFYSEVLRRRPAFNFLVRGMKTGEVKLLADTGIRCATVPCPASKEIYKAKIKNGRFSVPAELLLAGEAGSPQPGGSIPRGGRGRDLWFIFNDEKSAGVDVPGWLKKLPETIELKIN